jgi:hypothetical protein
MVFLDYSQLFHFRGHQCNRWSQEQCWTMKMLWLSRSENLKIFGTDSTLFLEMKAPAILNCATASQCWYSRWNSNKLE